MKSLIKSLPLQFAALCCLFVFFSSSRADDTETASQNSNSKKILFLAGSKSHGSGQHEYRAGSLLLAKALNEQSGLSIETEVISGWPNDPSAFEGIDALVIYDSATKMIGKHMDEVDALAKSGVGMMFLHYAVHPSPADGRKYYQPWTGGAFESNFSVNPFWIADLEPMPDHPVSRGIKSPVRAYDEFYYNMRFRDDRSEVLDLATAVPNRKNLVRVNNLWTKEGFEGLGQKQTLLWGTERPDGGRGAGFTGGHYHRNWALDDYRKLVLNTIVWVAGMDVPESGVKSFPITISQLNKNLDSAPARPLAPPKPSELIDLLKKTTEIPTPEKHAEKRKLQREKKAKERAKKTTALPKENWPKPSQLKVPNDLEVTLWASSPLLFNPTNMDTDSEGRIWVAEGVNYRRKRNPPHRTEGDRIVVLEDTDHDGRADSSHTFVQDPELISPLGVSVFGNRIVVAQPPDLIVYTDVDGDLRFDPKKDTREKVLSGFRGADHDHSLHAVVAGPDGRWYFNHGNTGAEFTTKAGSTYRVGGPYHSGRNLAGKRSDDGHLWTGGFLASMWPDGRDFRMLAHGFRNSYEHCLTSTGDIFQNDNDDPPACRVTWLMEGGFLGFFSRSGTHLWQADRRRGQDIPTAHWRQENPGTLPAGDIYGRGSPTGICYYENGALPEKYRGTLLSAEAHSQEIFSYQPEPQNAGMKLDRTVFLKADPGTWFRPSDVMVGADGALYVADWTDLKVGGHGTRDENFDGAIYRIAPKRFFSKIPKHERHPNGKPTLKGAISLLKNPAPNVRFEGLEFLKSKASTNGNEVRAALNPLLADENPSLRNRAIWLLPFTGKKGTSEVLAMLKQKDPTQRLLAFRVLRSAGIDFSKHYQNIACDPSPALRRELATSLRDASPEQKLPLAVTLFKSYHGSDRTYLEACGLAAEGIEEKVWSALYNQLPDPTPLAWPDHFARITWRLQPETALPALLERARSEKLTQAQRLFAIDTIAFTRSAKALGAMASLYRDSGGQNAAITEAATAWLLTRSSEEWQPFGGKKVLKDLGIFDPEKVTLQEVRLPEVNLKKQAKTKLPSAKKIAQMSADKTRGKALSVRCIICHQINGTGPDYGPDLRGWAANQGPESFISAIIDPHREIALGFEGQRVPLTDGREIQGILLSAADPITVRSTGGLTQMIPRSLLEKRTLSLRRSLMLSADELGLTAQDLADLAAFFKTYQ